MIKWISRYLGILKRGGKTYQNMANKLRYRKAWKWPGDVEAYIRSRSRGFIVHVCSGESLLGDLRIDCETASANIKADFRYLPLKDDIADTVLCDPPWEMQYHIRGKLVRELRRILKPGGYLIFDAPWSPKQPGLMLEEILVPTYQLMYYRNVHPLWVFRKVKGRMFPENGGKHGN